MDTSPENKEYDQFENANKADIAGDPKIMNYLSSINNKNLNIQNTITQIKNESLSSKKYILNLEARIEELEITNRALEEELDHIKTHSTSIQGGEQASKAMKEEIFRLKCEKEDFEQKCEDYEFKLNLIKEREKVHENSITDLKQVQNEYEQSIFELKNDYKQKESTLQKKYQIIQDKLKKQLNEKENEYEEQIIELNNKIEKLYTNNEKFKREAITANEKLASSENFFAQKESEFEELLYSKDKKLKELDHNIKSISEEANTQIAKLAESVNEFENKINYYKERELLLINENEELENKLKDTSTFIDRIDNNHRPTLAKNQKLSTFNMSSSKPNIITEEASERVADKLKSKLKDKKVYIKQLEDEIKDLKSTLKEADKDLNQSRNAINQMNHYINSKDTENNFQLDQFSKLEELCKNYEANLNEINNTYTQLRLKFEQQIKDKEEEVKVLKNYYEKVIRDLQLKLEGVLTRENIAETDDFYKSPNLRFQPENKSDNIKCERDIPNDSLHRSQIENKIGHLKAKLQNSVFS